MRCAHSSLQMRLSRCRTRESLAPWRESGGNSSRLRSTLDVLQMDTRHNSWPGRKNCVRLICRAYGLLREVSREFGARFYAELHVGVAEVLLDGFAGYEEGLRDLGVAEPACRHFGDATLTRREGLKTREAGTARARADRSELFVCLPPQDLGAA